MKIKANVAQRYIENAGDVTDLIFGNNLFPRGGCIFNVLLLVVSFPTLLRLGEVVCRLQHRKTRRHQAIYRRRTIPQKLCALVQLMPTHFNDKYSTWALTCDAMSRHLFRSVNGYMVFPMSPTIYICKSQ